MSSSEDTCWPYLVDKVDPSHRADPGRVVDETDVPLGGGVQLSDFNVPEPIQKLGPNVGPDSVADGDPHFVPLLIFSLQEDPVRNVTAATERRRADARVLTLGELQR